VRPQRRRQPLPRRRRQDLGSVDDAAAEIRNVGGPRRREQHPGDEQRDQQQPAQHAALTPALSRERERVPRSGG
jgi:hypothetical protein